MKIMNRRSYKKPILVILPLMAVLVVLGWWYTTRNENPSTTPPSAQEKSTNKPHPTTERESVSDNVDASEKEESIDPPVSAPVDETAFTAETGSITYRVVFSDTEATGSTCRFTATSDNQSLTHSSSTKDHKCQGVIKHDSIKSGSTWSLLLLNKRADGREIATKHIVTVQ